MKAASDINIVPPNSVVRQSACNGMIEIAVREHEARIAVERWERQRFRYEFDGCSD